MKKEAVKKEKLKEHKIELAIYLVIAIVMVGLLIGTYIFINNRTGKVSENKTDSNKVKEYVVKAYSKNDKLEDFPEFPMNLIKVATNKTLDFEEVYPYRDDFLTKYYEASIVSGKVVLKNKTDNKSYTLKQISNAKALVGDGIFFTEGILILTENGDLYYLTGMAVRDKNVKEISSYENGLKKITDLKFSEIGLDGVVGSEFTPYAKGVDNKYYYYEFDNNKLGEMNSEFEKLWTLVNDGTLRYENVDNVLKTSNGEIIYVNYLFFYEDEDNLSSELYIIDISRNLYKIDMNKYVANKVSDNPVKKVLENGSEYSVIYENNDKLKLGNYLHVFHR